MKNVISLHGDTIAPPYEPVESTIEELEDLLERAKSGEVKGIHAVIVYGDDSTGYVETLKAGFRSLGAINALSVKMATELNNE